MSERGQAIGKRVFARGKVRGIVFRVCCARSFLGRQDASKKISARDFFEKGRAGGKRTFASRRVLLSFMPGSLGESDDGTIDGLFDGLLVL